MRRRSRPLYGYKADDARRRRPGPRRVRPADLRGRQDRHGEDQVRRSSSRRPSNREVTSKDVKYAIERGFFNTVNNGYAGAYFGDLEGAKVGAKPGTKIKGITTPDDTTIEFHLTKGTGGVARRRARAAALGPGAGGVRGEVRQGEPVDVRPEPGRDRPVHDRERRVGQGDRLPGRPRDPPRPQPELGRRARTSGPRTWTRSTCRRATTTPRWRRARSSRATA